MGEIIAEWRAASFREWGAATFRNPRPGVGRGGKYQRCVKQLTHLTLTWG